MFVSLYFPNRRKETEIEKTHQTSTNANNDQIDYGQEYLPGGRCVTAPVHEKPENAAHSVYFACISLLSPKSQDNLHVNQLANNAVYRIVSIIGFHTSNMECEAYYQTQQVVEHWDRLGNNPCERPEHQSDQNP